MLKRYKQGTLRNGAAETRERMKEMVRTGCRRLRLSVGVCLVCAALQGGTAHADYGKPLDMPVLQKLFQFRGSFVPPVSIRASISVPGGRRGSGCLPSRTDRFTVLA